MERPLQQAKVRIIPYLERREFLYEFLILCLSAVLGSFPVGGKIAPLGPAIAAAVSMTRMNPAYAFAGVCIGAAVSSRWEVLVGLGFYFALCWLWAKWRENIKRGDRLFLLAVSQLLMMPLGYMNSIENCLYGVGNLAITTLMAPIFYKGLGILQQLRLRRVLGTEEQMTLVVAIAVLVMALSAIAPLGISLGAIAAVALCILAITVKGAAAMTAAVAFGAALVLGGGQPLLIVADLAVCTLCGCTLKQLGRWGTAAGFSACSLLIYAYVGPSYALPLPTLAAGAAIAVAMPKRTVGALAAAMDPALQTMRRDGYAALRIQKKAGERLGEVSSVLREVAGLYTVAVPNLERERESAVTAAAMSICAQCSASQQCWRDGRAAAQALIVMTTGREKAIPVPLHPRCLRQEPLGIAVNAALDQFEKRMEAERRANACMEYTYRQFEGVCSVVGALAEESKRPCRFDEALEARLMLQLDRERIRIRDISVQRDQGRIQCEVVLYHAADAIRTCDCASRALRRPLRMRLTPRAERIVLEEAYPLDVRFGVAAAPAPNSRISGDCMGARELGEGKLLLILSDGMGSGADAHRESAAAVALLGDLISVGFDIPLALESVNRLLIARSGAEIYATLDAVMIDMKDGSARFIKFGAPPCYLLRAGKVHTLYSEALPVGIVEEASPTIHHIKLQAEDIIVMMTDGAADVLGTELVALLCETVAPETAATDAAEKLVRLALARNPEDDSSVMVIKIGAVSGVKM